MPSLWHTAYATVIKVLIPVYIISWSLSAASSQISSFVQPLCQVLGLEGKAICFMSDPMHLTDHTKFILPTLAKTQADGFGFLAEHSQGSKSILMDLNEARVKIDDLIMMVRSVPHLPHGGEIVDALDNFREDAHATSKRLQALTSGLFSAMDRTLVATDHAFKALEESQWHPLDPRLSVCAVIRIAHRGHSWFCPRDPIPQIEAAVTVFESELKFLLGKASVASQSLEDLHSHLSLIQTLVSSDIISTSSSIEDALGSIWGYLIPFLPNTVLSDLRRQAGVLRNVMVYRERAHRYVTITEQGLEGMVQDVESIRRIIRSSEFRLGELEPHAETSEPPIQLRPRHKNPSFSSIIVRKHALEQHSVVSIAPLALLFALKFYATLLSPRASPKRPIHAAWELMLLQSEAFNDILDHIDVHRQFVPDILDARIAFDDIAELKRASGSSLRDDVILLGDLVNEIHELVRQYQQYNSRLASAIDRSIYASKAVLKALQDAQSTSYRWKSLACPLLSTFIRQQFCLSLPHTELSIFARVQDATAYIIHVLGSHTFELAHRMERLQTTYIATMEASAPITYGYGRNGHALPDNSTIWETLLFSFSEDVHHKFQAHHPELRDMKEPIIELSARLIRMGDIVASLQRGFYHVDPSSVPLGLESLPTQAETVIYLADVRDRLLAAKLRALQLRLSSQA
ncbi:hypothetical protein SISNIDRAFT_471826 [Sistotremastrum niveocremeum HHB9708]|uniref:Uncharacterized protein n=1 Tax=Sistotremastrum niveocremeum HHB9708 TaxID=1314777 RepID=A0A164M623_9AGAM|nr:hypothetical protein SISNIDRAFT_471826 [Sistotremastrum niveocremeum HHB9708]